VVECKNMLCLGICDCSYGDFSYPELLFWYSVAQVVLFLKKNRISGDSNNYDITVKR